MRKRFGFGKVIIIVIVILVLLAVGLIFKSRDYTQETLKLDASVLSALKKSGITEGSLRYEKQKSFKSGRHLFLKIERHYEVGPSFDRDDLLATIRKFLKKSRFSIVEAFTEKEGGDFLISFSFKNKILYELKFSKKRYDRVYRFKPIGAKIAIVLDDFGYNMNNVDKLFEIASPMTISILPNLPYSKIIAEEVIRHNFEVILHLPLEPYNEEVNLEKGTLMVDMPAQEINSLLVKAIESVPGLKGISNHMGSKATENYDFMKTLLGELKNRDLYFLDNLVTDKSVCEEVAGEIGIRIAKRSIFLDNESDESYIEKQIFHTARLAEKTGWAIGVGHDRPHTINVLAKVIPELKKTGFKFVYLSQIAE